MSRNKGFQRSSEAAKACGLSAPQYDLACRDRFIAFVKTLVGERVIVTTRDGQTHEGIVHVCTPFKTLKFQIVLRYCNHTNETAMIDAAEMVQLHAPAYPVVERRRADEFATDTAISARPAAGRERELQALDDTWFAQGDGMNLGKDLTPRGASSRLSRGSSGRSGTGAWDQFEANERLFNVKSSFDENLYTTQLDRRNVSLAQQREAERIAREIEGSVSGNSHLREERNQQTEQDNDMDEEERYSGVLGTGMLRERSSAAASTTAAYSSRGSNGTADNGFARTGSSSSSTAYRPPQLRSRDAAEQQLHAVLDGKLKTGAGSSASAGSSLQNDRASVAAPVALVEAKQAAGASAKTASSQASMSWAAKAKSSQQQQQQQGGAAAECAQLPEEQAANSDVKVAKASADGTAATAAGASTPASDQQQLQSTELSAAQQSSAPTTGSHKAKGEVTNSISTSSSKEATSTDKPDNAKSTAPAASVAVAAAPSATATATAAAKKSALNANAKSFVFNPSAKPFTPGAPPPAASATQLPAQPSSTHASQAHPPPPQQAHVHNSPGHGSAHGSAHSSQGHAHVAGAGAAAAPMSLGGGVPLSPSDMQHQPMSQVCMVYQPIVHEHDGYLDSTATALVAQS